MNFVRFTEPTYVWTGPGTEKDAVRISEECFATILDIFPWHTMEAVVFVLPNGTIAWTPVWTRGMELFQF